MRNEFTVMLLPKIYPVTCHTNHVGPGSTFVAIQGYECDGRKFIAQALKRGATCIVQEASHSSPYPVLTSDELLDEEKIFSKTIVNNYIKYLYVDNARKALAVLVASELDFPASKLSIIGVTGTKGKTTTVYAIEHTLKCAGYTTALLSSIEHRIGNDAMKSDLTTMASDALHMFFAECFCRGVTHVVMEVSAHALSLYRTYGIKFTGVCFTNLAYEHMDFYSTLDEYFAAKQQICTQIKRGGFLVVDRDMRWGQKLEQQVKNDAHFRTISVHSFTQMHDMRKETVLLSIEKSNLSGIHFSLTEGGTSTQFFCPTLFGKYNVSNLTMAILATRFMGIEMGKSVAALQQLPSISGRLQRHVLWNGAIAFIDYAHNPSSFEEVLSTLREVTGDLIVVFGCGGNRDSSKRPFMGKIATTYGDRVIITSDNPRFEDPKSIIDHIMAGISPQNRQNVSIEINRKKAFARAVSYSCAGSIIAILGKGHEDYFLVKGKRLHFDDLKEISQL